MQRGSCYLHDELGKQMPFRPRKRISACISILGMVTLSYVLGAVVMFFQLPTSGFLGRALLAAHEWRESRKARHVDKYAAAPSAPAVLPVVRSEIDRPGETFDGFTLCTFSGEKEPDSQALLINMRHEVVHRWAVPFSRVYPNPSHLATRLPDSLAWFWGTYLYANGDLLVVFHGRTPTGAGLAKIDKDSNVLWAYPGAIHHDVDVAEDGSIYALEHHVVDKLPSGLERIRTPTVDDSLVLLSPDGKALREPISLLLALRDSPYAELLEVLKWPTKPHVPPEGSGAPSIDRYVPTNALHSNCVRVLRKDMAAKFPAFKPGHVLVSLRDISAIVMIDPVAAKVEWGACGPWFAQHDPQFLENGHLLIFDNLGSPQGSRVLEYDPQTGSFPWSYSSESRVPFYTSERGMCQRLPNGNTLIVNSEGGEVFEVTFGKKVVWSFSVDRFIATARRYAAHQLPFLGDTHRARP